MLLGAIGRVYANEAATFLGGGNPFAVGLNRLRRTGQNLRSQLQVRRGANVHEGAANPAGACRLWNRLLGL